jgi:predicted N-acetyltransferase YhbS
MGELTLRRARDWAEVERAAAVTAAAFAARPDRGDVDPERFRERTVGVPGLALDNVLLGFVDGDVVCGLQLYDRWTVLNGHRLPFAGVGNVMCHPDHQGKGYGSRLMEYAVSVVEDAGYPLSILRGDRSLYRRYGWERIHASRTVARDPSPVSCDGAPEHANYELRAYDAERLDDLRRVHRTTVRRTDAVPWRTRPIWTDWVFELGFAEPEDLLLYCDDSGTVEGYLAVGERDGAPVCREVGHVYADDARRDAFLAACWNELGSRPGGTDRLVWRPPWLPPRAAERSAALEAERASSASIRACDTELLSTVAGRGIASSEDLVEYVQAGPWYWPGLDGF